MKKNTTKSSDGLKIIYNRFYAGRPDRIAALAEEQTNAEIARRIYDIRIKAGLTHAQLASLVGTTPSVISRLEDADYDGHSLSMLRRIAAALHQRLEIRFVPANRRLQTA